MQRKSFRFSFLMCMGAMVALCTSLSYATKSIPTSEVSRHQLLVRTKNDADNMRSFCAGMHKCLDIKYEACSEVDLKPWPKVN
jgi:hypothetical protein